MSHPLLDPRLGRGARPAAVPLHVAERLQAERDALATQLQHARRALAELERARAAEEQELRHLHQALRAVQAQNEALRARVGAEPAEALAEARGRAEHAEHVLASVERQRAEAQRRADHLAGELELSRAEAAALEAERDAARAAAREAEARLAEAETCAPDPARMQRLAADLANLQRRRDADVAAARRVERAAGLARLADVRDSLQRAVDAHTDRTSLWYQGNRGILAQLDHELAAAGATRTGDVGEVFDPHLHEALARVDGTGQPAGTIVQVERPGYVLPDGHLVRAARVLVAG